MAKHKVKLTISILIVVLAITLNLITGWILWYGVGYFLLLLLHYQDRRIPLVVSLLIMIFVGALTVGVSFWLANILGIVFMKIILFVVFLIITTLTIGKWKMKNDLW